MLDGRQRQRHGVSKNLAEGIGGLLVGAAAVLLLRAWLGPRTATAPSLAPAAAPEARPQAKPTSPAPAKPRRRAKPKTKPESEP